MKKQFQLGDLLFTKKMQETCKEEPAFAEFVLSALNKHQEGDWGTICESDWHYNDQCLAEHKDRLFSSYSVNIASKEAGNKIWIITNLNPNHTTVLFPNEY